MPRLRQNGATTGHPVALSVQCDYTATMSRRPNTDEASEVYVRARCTTAERDQWVELAREQDYTLSQLIRRLLKAEERRIRGKARA